MCPLSAAASMLLAAGSDIHRTFAVNVLNFVNLSVIPRAQRTRRSQEEPATPLG